MINDYQREIIENSVLPAYVIAGPGTGKTHTIVEYVIKKVKDEGFDPSKIVITTFTNKASAELNARIIEGFKREGLKLNLKDLKIGNFHSLAMDYLSRYKNLDDDFFSKEVIDNNMEVYLLEKNLDQFEKIPNFSYFIKDYKIATILSIFKDITNNLVSLDKLNSSYSKKDRLCYEIYKTYKKILDDKNIINFQLILKNFYDLLKNPTSGARIREDIDLLIIDEYQDTNYIQQEIAFLLIKNKNIIVFGDDDQSLYSFRGADAKNLTDFSKICMDKLKVKANKYELLLNYRSNQEIIDFSKDFISPIKEESKDLESINKEKNSNSLVRARASELDNLVKIVKILAKNINLNQIAFLFPSFTNPYPASLQKAFEKAGIRVINKKNDNFFKSYEVRMVLFIILRTYLDRPEALKFFGNISYEQKRKLDYRIYLANIYDDNDFKSKEDLLNFIRSLSRKNLRISELIYRLMGQASLKNIMDDRSDTYKNEVILSNISALIGLTIKFEDLFMKDHPNNFYHEFIYGYLFIYFKSGYNGEDENIKEVKDAITFMTIHQAKGLEFEAVFVSSLNDYPRANIKSFIDDLNKGDFRQKDLDFYRKYYTAFTRAKNLLVILDNSRDFRIARPMEKLDNSSKLNSLDFRRKSYEKEVKTLAYTTDLEVYMACPLKYKFLRKFSFKLPKTRSLIRGSRIHELSEYVISNDYQKKDLEKLLIENPSYKLAIENILARNFLIRDVEANYNLARKDFILQGNIDLILADGSIVDIKTGKIDKKLLEKYKNQLITYKYLREMNGERVISMFLYFIEEDELIEVFEKDFNLNIIDEVGKNIIEENFNIKTNDLSQCRYCPMKYYCDRLD